MPCAVVSHTAAYRKVLLVKIDVLSSQAADLANAKSRIVGDLYGQQGGISLAFQIVGQLQVLFVGYGRSGNGVSIIITENIRYAGSVTRNLKR